MNRLKFIKAIKTISIIATSFIHSIDIITTMVDYITHPPACCVCFSTNKEAYELEMLEEARALQRQRNQAQINALAQELAAERAGRQQDRRDAEAALQAALAAANEAAERKREQDRRDAEAALQAALQQERQEAEAKTKEAVDAAKREMKDAMLQLIRGELATHAGSSASSSSQGPVQLQDVPVNQHN